MREGQEHRDLAKYKANFDAIDFSDAEAHDPSPSGRYVMRAGKLTPVEQAGYDGVRKRDATNIRSFAAGIHVDQVPEWNRQFKGQGVQFDPTNGDAIFKDRQSRLKHLRQRGLVDKHEIKGGSSRHTRADENLWLKHAK